MYKTRLRSALAALAVAALSQATFTMAQANGHAGGQKGARAAVSTKGQTATALAPLTVRIKPTPALRAAIENAVGEGTTVEVGVEVVQPHANAWEGLRVFLNAPDADAKTPIESQQYVGSVAFYGEPAGRVAAFSLDAAKVLRHLKRAGAWKSGDELSVTLVPIPSAAARAGTKLAVRKVTVSIPDASEN